jgi:hypothetical protein
MDKLYKIGKINSNLILNYENLNYFNKPFNDAETVKKWRHLGHNYEKYTGLMLDQSKEIPKWCFNISKKFSLKNSGIILYCMTPGTIMPEHSDTFSKYREIMNISATENVARIIIFLEDWKSGHYFEINETPIVNWKKGQYILWKNDTPHMAANLGKENRYTMQITGIYV